MALPNPYTDGSYDSPGDPGYGVGAGTSAPEVIALQQHPEVLQDPTVQAAQTPEARTMAIITVLKKTDPSFDPQGVYKVNQDGTVSPNNSSWFSDHLPLITGLMGAAIGAGGLLAGVGASAGGASAAASGSTDAGVTGVEGVTPGLTEAGVSGLGTGAMGAVPVAGGTAAGATGAFDAAGNFVGDSTVTGAGSTVPITADGGAFDADGNFIGDSTYNVPGTGVLSEVGKYAKALSGVGGAISSATDAATKNRLAQNDPYVQRGKLEDTQRNQDLRNIYMASKAQNPTKSPFDPVAPTLPSGNYASALTNLSNQGASALAAPPQYNVGSFPSLQPGTLATIGQLAGPILKTIGSLPGLLPGF